MVFNDADIPSAVAGAAFACFIASGQTCVSGTRLVLQDGIYDEFMEQFLKKVESITARMGNRTSLYRLRLTKSPMENVALNERTTMGTVISHQQLERIEKLVQRPHIGNVLAGGQRLSGLSPLDGHDYSKGSFFPPTVISDVHLDDDLWREEVFGPVVVVRRFYVSVCCPVPISGRCLPCFDSGRIRRHRAGECVQVWAWRGYLDERPLSGSPGCGGD